MDDAFLLGLEILAGFSPVGTGATHLLYRAIKDTGDRRRGITVLDEHRHHAFSRPTPLLGTR